MGIAVLSDQTGHYEAIVFSEGLGQYRDLLEPGRALLLVLQAGLEGEDVRARIQSAELLDEAVARRRTGLRIFLDDERPVASVAERLRERADGRGEGEVSLVLILEGGDREVEIRLPGRYQASPQVAGPPARDAGRGAGRDELRLRDERPRRRKVRLLSGSSWPCAFCSHLLPDLRSGFPVRPERSPCSGAKRSLFGA